MNPDLSTADGVLALCAETREEMANLFNQLGRFEINGYSFGGYVLATCDVGPVPDKPDATAADWTTGAKLDQITAFAVILPEWIGKLIPPEKHTEFFSHAVRRYAELTRAIGTLIMAETWYVHYEQDPAKPAMTPGDARASFPDSLEDAEGRREMLMLSLEHPATGPRIWRAEIKRDPDRLEPWEDTGYKEWQGRLSNLTHGARKKPAPGGT